MWRHLPRNLYLLVHALVFLGGFIYWTSLLDSTIATLGRAVRRRSLVIQSVLFAGATFFLGIPFLLLAQSLIMAATQGCDPLELLRVFLMKVHPVFVLALLVPFSLTLSLVWAAKDAGTEDAPGTDLQRVQIVKGSVDASGATHEQVFDAAGDANDGARSAGEESTVTSLGPVVHPKLAAGRAENELGTVHIGLRVRVPRPQVLREPR